MKRIFKMMSLLLVLVMITGCTQWYKNGDILEDKEVGPIETKTEQDIEASENQSDETVASSEEKNDEAIDIDQDLDLTGGDSKEDELEEDDSKEDSDDTTEKNVVDEEKAKDLNTEGYDKYKAKDYEGALALFEASIEANEDYFYAHYNYACTLGVLMKLDYPMWYEKKEDAMNHLKKVLALNPDYKEKVKTDSDLEMLRTEYQYYELLGYDMTKASDVSMFVENLNWYIQGPGIYTVIGGIDFKANNRFRLYHLDFALMDDPNFVSKPVEFFGSYAIENGVIKFKLDNAMPKTIYIPENGEVDETYTEFEGVLKEGGEMNINIFDFSIYSWYDEFSA